MTTDQWAKGVFADCGLIVLTSPIMPLCLIVCLGTVYWFVSGIWKIND